MEKNLFVHIEWPDSQYIEKLSEEIQEECIGGEDGSIFLPIEYIEEFNNLKLK